MRTYDVRLTMLGLSQGADFEKTGKLSISVLPQSPSGAGLADKRLNYTVTVTDPPGTGTRIDNIVHSPPANRGIYGMLMDSSGSIRGDKTERNQAASTMIEELFKQAPDSKIGLFDWSGSNNPRGADELNTVYDFATADKQDELVKATEQISATGNTPLYESIHELLIHLDSTRTQNVKPGVIALTDGKDSGTGTTLDEVIKKAQELSIPVYIIGISDAARGHRDAEPRTIAALERLTDKTGGVYTSVTDLKGLDKFARAIAQGATLGFDKTLITVQNPPKAGTELKGTIQASGRKVRSSNAARFGLTIQ